MKPYTVYDYLYAATCAFLVGFAVTFLTACGKPQQGPAGASCSVSQTTYGIQMECPGQPPVSVYNGSDGLDGLEGPKGDMGAQGPAGQDASQITVVQFCSGSPSYGNWLESGLCVSNKLYAVFWQNNKPFWAVLPAGTYNSTDGAACTFTVGANCQVSH